MSKAQVRRRSRQASAIRQTLVDGDASSLVARARRYRRLARSFPITGGMLILGGYPAWLALEEMWRSYIGANFLAVVLCAQVFVEHSLATHHILSGDDAKAEAGFAKLIEEATSAGAIRPKLSERLHRLRRMRNPYVHPRSYSRPRNYMERIVEGGKAPLDLLEADAEFALDVVAEFIRPGKPQKRAHKRLKPSAADATAERRG